MADPEWEKLKEFFHTALALPPKDRPAYLDRACAGDAFLRQSVEALLKSHEESGFVDAEVAARVEVQHDALVFDARESQPGMPLVVRTHAISSCSRPGAAKRSSASRMRKLRT